MCSRHIRAVEGGEEKLGDEDEGDEKLAVSPSPHNSNTFLVLLSRISHTFTFTFHS